MVCCRALCSGAAPAWHLQHVEITNNTTGARAVFYANAWLDAKQGTSTLVLQAGSAEGKQTAQNKWKLSVQTRCVVGDELPSCMDACSYCPVSALHGLPSYSVQIGSKPHCDT